MVYEYQAGQSDIKRIENEYLNEKKDDLRATIETLTTGVQYRREKSYQQTQKILKDKLEEVFAMAAQHYSKYNSEESSELTKQYIMDLFMSSKITEGNGYFWILDTDHTMVAHPYNKNLVGKDQSQLEDKNGKKFFQEFIQTAQQQKDGGFVSYSWTEPDVSSLLQQEKDREKIAFVKVFQPYNWVVGVGLYVHDIEKLVQQEIIGRFDTFPAW